MGVLSTSFPGSFTPRERDTIPTVQEGGWAPRPVWTGAEKLAPTGIRSLDFPPLSSRYTDYIVPAHDCTK